VMTVLVALPIIGAVYQTLSVRHFASRFPPPGRLIDVGGRRLHLVCVGQGEPAVIFESSGFGNSLSSEMARAEVAARTRVCSYDRMGTGWSDPGPDIISVGLLADDLQSLLDRAALPPPYILVPASIGGLTVEMFARRHPDEVAGLVFVDAAESEVVERWAPSIHLVQTEVACLGKVAARLGILRALDPFHFRQKSNGAAARAMAVMYRAEPMATLCGVVRGAATSRQEFRDAPPLNADVPLVVLSHDRPEGLLPPRLEPLLAVAPQSLASRAAALTSEWYPMQQRLARRSTRGRWRIVPGSDHLIGNSQPHAVASVVLEMLAQIRGSEKERDGK
jgi:pimeloyl-ACP methyl ester carboxylesterase